MIRCGAGVESGVVVDGCGGKEAERKFSSWHTYARASAGGFYVEVSVEQKRRCFVRS